MSNCVKSLSPTVYTETCIKATVKQASLEDGSKLRATIHNFGRLHFSRLRFPGENASTKEVACSTFKREEPQNKSNLFMEDRTVKN